MIILKDLTSMLDEECKSYISIARIVEDDGTIFLEFKFNSTIEEEEQVKIAECIGKNIMEDKRTRKVFLDQWIGIRILKD